MSFCPPKALALFVMVTTLLVAGVARSEEPDCTNNPSALGVSRVIEIDTKGGPGYGYHQYRMNTLLDDKEVVLTFDDGPLPVHTRAILKALDQHCTKATFFSVGRMALAYPDTVKDIIKRGHTLGAHTWSHRYQLGKVPANVSRNEIELGFSAVQKAAGQPIAPFFRFPFLSDSRPLLQYLGDRDLAVFSIDVDAIDYRAKSADRVIANVFRELEPQRKGILLFHDIQPSTAAALPEVLRQLKARGYRVVHLKPREQVHTLAAHDAAIEQEVARLNTKIAERPLAPRTLTWAMTDKEIKAERLAKKPVAKPTPPSQPVSTPTTTASTLVSEVPQQQPPRQVSSIAATPKPVTTARKPLVREHQSFEVSSWKTTVAVPQR